MRGPASKICNWHFAPKSCSHLSHPRATSQRLKEPFQRVFTLVFKIRKSHLTTEITEVCDKGSFEESGSFEEKWIRPHTVRTEQEPCRQAQTRLATHTAPRKSKHTPGLCGAQGMREVQLNCRKGFRVAR